MTPFSPTPRRSRGFTLVEVVVALAIVVVGMAALFTTINQSASNSIYLRERTFAQWIAMNRITEVRLAGQVPADDALEGELEYAGQSWRWELETIPTPVKGIFRLEARAAPEEAPEDYWPGQATGFMGDAIAPPSTPNRDWLGTGTASGQQPGGLPGEPGTPPPEDQPPSPSGQPQS